ncbi:DNA recombination/repair protein RecA, partial [Patescibacteria group bacterium]|nr:DNA recombination/repair protein RecA [Patescibacteria group bacterium]
DLLDCGAELGVIKKAGNSYSYGEEKLGVGRENAKRSLRERPELFKELREKSIAAWREREEAASSLSKPPLDKNDDEPPLEE